MRFPPDVAWRISAPTMKMAGAGALVECAGEHVFAVKRLSDTGLSQSNTPADAGVAWST